MEDFNKFNVYNFVNGKDKTYPKGFVSSPGFSLQTPVRVKSTGSDNSEFAIQTDKPYVRESKNPSYYFEISITQLHTKGVISIGFAKEDFPKSTALVGWNPNSFGIHSDDGSLFSESGSQAKVKDYSPLFGAGDTIGCGITKSGEVYFTINGQKLPKAVPVKIQDGEYYPTVAVDYPNTSFEANFGSSPFLYESTEEWQTYKQQQVLQNQLNSKTRYLSHISTDKPIYRAGDTLFFRAFLLHAHDQSILTNELASSLFGNKSFSANVKITEPSGSEVFNQNISGVKNSALCGRWKIPEGQKGGDYTLKVNYWAEGLPQGTQKFNIRAFASNPQLKMQLEFVKKGIGCGDEAVANLEVSRAIGGAASGAKVSSVARVDGEEVFKGEGKLDKEGKLTVKFVLPQKIEMGDGTLTCTVNDSGTIESKGQTIPILMQGIDMNFYPEGGELIAGVPNGLYVEAFTPSGDPADFSADIVDESGLSYGLLQTVHEGRGRGEFIPQSGTKYFVRVYDPSGITKQNELPIVQPEGIALSSKADVFEADAPVLMRVSATNPGKYRVEFCKKEKVLVTSNVETVYVNESKEIEVFLPSDAIADGVIRVTVFDESNVPKAERLVFRRPQKTLKIDIETDKENYSIGETVNMKIRAFGDDGLPSKAVLGVCVTDDTVLEMVDKRKQVPRLPVQAFLQNEVDHLEDAQIYLDPSNPKSDIACDLLLGTQGWRRFAFVEVAKFLENTKSDNKDTKFRAKAIEDAERLLCVHTKQTAPVYEVPKPVVFEEQLLFRKAKKRVFKEKKRAPRMRMARAPAVQMEMAAKPVALAMPMKQAAVPAQTSSSASTDHQQC